MQTTQNAKLSQDTGSDMGDATLSDAGKMFPALSNAELSDAIKQTTAAMQSTPIQDWLGRSTIRHHLQALQKAQQARALASDESEA